MEKSLNDLVYEIGQSSIRNGFRCSNRTPGEFFAMIHRKVSEIFEEFEKEKGTTEIDYQEDGEPKGMPMALADVIIHCLDMADYFGINLESAIQEKMEYYKNESPDRKMG